MDGRFGILFKQFVELGAGEIDLRVETLVETFVDSAALAFAIGDVEHIDVRRNVGCAFGLRPSKGEHYSFQFGGVTNHPEGIFGLRVPRLTVGQLELTALRAGPGVELDFRLIHHD